MRTTQLQILNVVMSTSFMRDESENRSERKNRSKKSNLEAKRMAGSPSADEETYI